MHYLISCAYIFCTIFSIITAEETPIVQPINLDPEPHEVPEQAPQPDPVPKPMRKIKKQKRLQKAYTADNYIKLYFKQKYLNAIQESKAQLNYS